jgi:ATP-dependent RNA helicase DDX10/DBP4
MEDEEAFKARGDVDAQREKFLEAEAERTRQADIVVVDQFRTPALELEELLLRLEQLLASL